MFRSFIKNPLFTLVLTVSSTVLIAPGPPAGTGTRPSIPGLRPGGGGGGGGGQPGLTTPPLLTPPTTGGASIIGRPPGGIGTSPMIAPPLVIPAPCPVGTTSYNGTECSNLGCSGSWTCETGYALPSGSSATGTSACNNLGTCNQPAGAPPKCRKNEGSIFNDPSGASEIPAMWNGGYCTRQTCALTVACSGGCVPSQLTLQGRCQSTTNCVANGGINTLPQCVRGRP